MNIETYLIWFLIGLGFLLLEMTMPSFVIFFFGIGALTVSIITGFISNSLSFNTQIIIFITSSIFYLLILRNSLKNIFFGSQTSGYDKDNDNQNDQQKYATVSKEIKPGEFGEIKFKGSYYKAQSDANIKENENVEVIDYNHKNSAIYNVKKIKEN